MATDRGELPPAQAADEHDPLQLARSTAHARPGIACLLLICCLVGCSHSAPNGPGERRKTAGNRGAVQPEAARSVATRMRWAQQYISESRFADAEKELRAALEQAPDDGDVHALLSILLNTEGRRWEASACLERLLRLGRFSIQDLIMLGTPREKFEDTPVIDTALYRVPDDPLPGIGLIQPFLRVHKIRESQELLEKVLAKYPEQIEAHALYGRLLLDQELDEEFVRWNATLPAVAETHPEVWFSRAMWSERHQQWESAARCYWETLRRQPQHRIAYYNLGLVLKRLGRLDIADQFMQFARSTAELETTVFPMFSDGPNLEAMRHAAAMTEQMGRLWEAWGWQIAILSVEPGQADATAARDRLRARLDQEQPPLLLASATPLEHLDLSAYAPPHYVTSAAKTPPAASTSLPPGVQPVNFVDKAEEAGIAFRYFDSWVAAGRELMLLENMGGGVAILDYDNDGWQDIYLTQCCKWPVDLADMTYLDRLYRNLGDGTFADVTESCGIRENGYSQGVAAGDFDNDGYTDLYVGNVGQNRLYHNNGDGTFSLVPHHEDTRIVWTTSVMIADVNHDNLPDLFDVNYLTGDDVFTRHCVVEGQLRSCGPAQFDGEPDSLFLNAGDGRWRDVSDTSGIRTLPGRGVGVVAADFDASGDPQIYVANDAMENSLWVRQPGTDGSQDRWVDHGLLSGTACDGSGRPQASMGIACDDISGDGLLDLLVGNFFKDFCTLYIQQPGRFFVDSSREYGLVEPTFLMLTFGSQFLDGDLDGRPDLAIANGHIDDLRFRGEPWHMRPQYFHNLHGTSYVELQGENAGSFFDKEYLGRGLALVDWNRDGREDLVQSNIADMACLATNLTEPVGHFLAIRLCGVKSPRDPIGARVAIQVDGNTHIRQLVGGSGFQASNQPQLIFGLGAADHVDTLTVFWPDGLTQEFANVPIETELILVEGAGQLEHVPIDR
jgi:tetratricopeptide (TPR) repeat protein